MLEGLRLRVKDVDFERREIIVRDGKGGRDRRTARCMNTTTASGMGCMFTGQTTKVHRDTVKM